jgi:hypothetical protein
MRDLNSDIFVEKYYRICQLSYKFLRNILIFELIVVYFKSKRVELYCIEVDLLESLESVVPINCMEVKRELR